MSLSDHSAGGAVDITCTVPIKKRFWEGVGFHFGLRSPWGFDAYKRTYQPVTLSPLAMNVVTILRAHTGHAVWFETLFRERNDFGTMVEVWNEIKDAGIHIEGDKYAWRLP